jgi:hypothetical protein
MIDIEKYKNQKVKLSRPGAEQEHEMSVYELSRWCALIDAVEVVDKKLKQLGSRAPNDKVWVKPIALQKYVDEKFESILFDITSGDDNKKVIDDMSS